MNTKLRYAIAITIVLIILGSYLWHGSQANYDLSGKTIAILIGEGFYDSEATMPIAFFQKAGATVITTGPSVGDIAGSLGGKVSVTHSLKDLRLKELDCLIIPGGNAPFNLREDQNVISLVREIALRDKLLAVVGRGARILIRADLVQGKSMTTWQDTVAELLDAGAVVEQKKAVLRDGQIITTRGPGDLKGFCKSIAIALLED